ncbi:MAG: Ribosomal protein S17E [Cenarchaeum symbiont of Oopsacas minuta]|nr:Ribosomal protein S17E [Cenarchaeum symbiont of Oopsacas minuta]
MTFVDRIRKISNKVLEENRSNFGINFDENKVALESLSIIRSKSLKNKITGHITRSIKKEIYEKEEKAKREKIATEKPKAVSKSQTEEE